MINHNYILTSESYVPTGEPGGGSWSILQYTLRVLYDDFVAARNWWTKGNTGLPLARYIMCKCKFYRSELTDYIVTIERTGPFEVSLDSYLSTQPSRHLMNHNAFIVPKLGRGPNKRTYIRKKIYPPALFFNKWYFQQDIYNIPLFMLTVSACSLDQMYAPEDQISNNITLISLNTTAIQMANWERQPYSTKAVGTENIYLWGYGNQHSTENPTWQHIILLGNIKQYTNGQTLNSTNYTDYNQITDEKNKTKWGNPFTYQNQHKDNIIYYGKKPNLTSNSDITNPQKFTLLPLESLYVKCRYNPFKDKGKGNKVYFIPTDTGNGSFLSLPQNSKIYIENLPLWLILWGWGDWILKSKPITHLQEEWQLIIQSPYIYPPQPAYLFLDNYFVYPPQYTAEMTETDLAHWHPKYEMQREQLEAIAKTGPGAPKLNHSKQIEAHMLYDFYFKWGGNPAPMETITDPSEQEKFPTPSNQLQGLAVESPGKPKQYYLYAFDEKRSIITPQASKRLKKDYSTPTFFTDYGPKDIPIKAQEETDTSSEEEETQTQQTSQEFFQQQLQLQRLKYRRKLEQLLKTKKLFPQ